MPSDISGGYRVHPGARIQEDPSAPSIYLGPSEILRAQPTGEGILVPIAEGSLGGIAPYWGLLAGGLRSPCLPFPFLFWGARGPLPPAPPFGFNASRSSISCSSGSRGSFVHSLQRWPSSRQLKQRPNRASALSAACTMPIWKPWSIQ